MFLKITDQDVIGLNPIEVTFPERVSDGLSLRPFSFDTQFEIEIHNSSL